MKQTTKTGGYRRYILITGGAGNIGGSLASRLCEDSTNYVVVVDNLSTGCIQNLPSREYENFLFIKGDVNSPHDILTIMSSRRFDYVFHYAAVVGVNRTLENPLLVYGDIDGFKNILSAAKNTGVKRVFFSSSSEVYGEPFEIPQNERTTPLNSKLPYAIVKNLGESFLKTYHTEYDLSYTILRFFNTYGPRQSEEFVMSKFINLALRGEPIPIYGDGSQTRTFCYIKDNLDVTIKILNEGLLINETANIGNDQEITILELAETIIDVTNSPSKIEYLPPLAEGDMTRRCPDVTKMRSLLGRELTGLRVGIQHVVDSFTTR